MQLPGLTPSIFARNLFCIGRNYAEHAKEMNSPIPSEPLVFLKPTSSLCRSGATVLIPRRSQRVDHEVEIVLAIAGLPGRKGKNIPIEEAHEWIAGIGVGIDFTARDLQAEAKKSGNPWSVSKGFDTFAAISEFIPGPFVASALSEITIRLECDSELRQQGSSKEMLFSIPALIAYLSGIFTLDTGDLIFTGTPSGVAPIRPGNRLRASLSGFPSAKALLLELSVEDERE